MSEAGIEALGRTESCGESHAGWRRLRYKRVFPFRSQIVPSYWLEGSEGLGMRGSGMAA